MDDAETATVNVRRLISVYENSEPNDEEIYSPRTRAMSLGDVLDKDVTVKSHDYNSLNDIQEALQIVDKELNIYNVYNKALHVKFQEILFTLLTSLINIEADANDYPDRKSDLITHTKKLVSVLNRKLPNSFSFPQSTNKQQGNVQNKTEGKKGTAPSSSKSVVQKQSSRIQIQSKAKNQQSTTVDEKSCTDSSQENEITSPEQVTDDLQDSVTNLRSIFEKKVKENKTGLEVILKPKIFQYSVQIPYTAASLGLFRLSRTNSSKYISQVGLLNRVDISRAKSTTELNTEEKFNSSIKETTIVQEKSYEDDSKSTKIKKSEVKQKQEVHEEVSGRISPGYNVSVRDAIDVFESIPKRKETTPVKSLEPLWTFSPRSEDRNISLLRRDSVKEIEQTHEQFPTHEEINIKDSLEKPSIEDGRNISLSSVKKLAKAFEKMPAEENGSESLQRPSPIQISEENNLEHNGEVIITPTINTKSDIPLLRRDSVKDIVKTFEKDLEDEILVETASIILQKSSSIKDINEVNLEHDDELLISENVNKDRIVLLARRDSVKDIVKTFENFPKTEQTYVKIENPSEILQTSSSIEDENGNNLIEGDEILINQNNYEARNITLIRRDSVKQIIKTFEKTPTEEEIHALMAHSSDILHSSPFIEDVSENNLVGKDEMFSTENLTNGSSTAEVSENVPNEDILSKPSTLARILKEFEKTEESTPVVNTVSAEDVLVQDAKTVEILNETSYINDPNISENDESELFHQTVGGPTPLPRSNLAKKMVEIYETGPKEENVSIQSTEVSEIPISEKRTIEIIETTPKKEDVLIQATDISETPISEKVTIEEIETIPNREDVLILSTQISEIPMLTRETEFESLPEEEDVFNQAVEISEVPISMTEIIEETENIPNREDVLIQTTENSEIPVPTEKTDESLEILPKEEEVFIQKPEISDISKQSYHINENNNVVLHESHADSESSTDESDTISQDSVINTFEGKEANISLNQDPVEKYEHISTEEKVNIQTSMTSRMFKKSLLIDSSKLENGDQNTEEREVETFTSAQAN